jgi:hypothetical protein
MEKKTNIRNLIEKNKLTIIPELYEWAETFDSELDEDKERTLEPYYMVFSLVERLEKNQLTNREYEEILFHIEQINHDEIKIQL